MGVRRRGLPVLAVALRRSGVSKRPERQTCAHWTVPERPAFAAGTGTDMRRLFFAFLLIPLALPAQRVADIRIHPAITHRWSLMYREFSTEWLDCIYGKIIGDTVQIVGVFPS